MTNGGACAWSKKPADIASLFFRNFIGFLRAEPHLGGHAH